MYVEIIRLETSKYGTLSALRINGQFFGTTLEPPDELNKVNESSIPPGQYWMKKYDSPTHGLVWKVENVPNRTYIEIHPGNIVEHTAGCILVGESQAKLRGPQEHIKLLNSGKTFDNFMSALDDGNEYHKLAVKELF